jgi:signal peptidase I
MRQARTIRDIALIGFLTLGAVALFFVAVLGYQPNVLDGRSMEPTIAHRSLVIVKTTDSAAVGDVAKVNYHGIPTLHRVIEVTSEGYRTKGDNPELYPDAELVPFADLQGVAVFTVPALGPLWPFILDNGIKLLIISVAAVLIWLIAAPGRERRAVRADTAEAR